MNGSVVLFSEAAAEHALACIRSLLESGHRALDVRWEPFQKYNERVDAAWTGLAVGVSKANTWYKNSFGRVSQNWPHTTIEYWLGTRGPSAQDYEYL